MSVPRALPTATVSHWGETSAVPSQWMTRARSPSASPPPSPQCAKVIEVITIESDDDETLERDYDDVYQSSWSSDDDDPLLQEALTISAATTTGGSSMDLTDEEEEAAVSAEEVTTTTSRSSASSTMRVLDDMDAIIEENSRSATDPSSPPEKLSRIERILRDARSPNTRLVSLRTAHQCLVDEIDTQQSYLRSLKDQRRAKRRFVEKALSELCQMDDDYTRGFEGLGKLVARQTALCEDTLRCIEEMSD